MQSLLHNADTGTDPASLFNRYAYLAVLKANDWKVKMAPFSYQRSDLIQEGLIALWKAVNKPQVQNTTRPSTLKGYFSTCIYRALGHLKHHVPHISYHTVEGLK